MKKIRLGVIGAGGGVSMLHAPGYLSNEKVKIVAVCRRHEDQARVVAKELGADRYYTDYNDLLKDKEVDAVDILTPHHLHKEMSVAAAEAGKHVSVQKPMALNIKEADEMINAARKAGVKLSVFDNYVFYPPIEKAKEMIDKGDVGEPSIIRMEMVPGTPKSYLHTPESFEWRADLKKAGGGVIFDAMHHHFSTAQLLMGDFEKVHAWIDKSDITITENEIKYEMPVMITWSHKKGGRYGNISANAAPKMYMRSKYYVYYDAFELQGTTGIIWVTSGPAALNKIPRTVLYKDGNTVYIDTGEDDWGVSFIRGVNDFVDCILDDRRPRLTGEDGRKMLQVILAVYKSAKEERDVRCSEIT